MPEKGVRHTDFTDITLPPADNHEHQSQRLYFGHHRCRHVRHEPSVCLATLRPRTRCRLRAILPLSLCHSHTGCHAPYPGAQLPHRTAPHPAALRHGNALCPLVAHPFRELQLYGQRHCLHPALCLSGNGGGHHDAVLRRTTYHPEHALPCRHHRRHPAPL